jgi:hypothetical protein
MSLKIERP